MTLADLAPVVIPLVILVVVIGRQLRWRTRGDRPVWRQGALFAVVGAGLVLFGSTGAAELTRSDLLYGVGGLAFSALSGFFMGRLTVLRKGAEGIEYRLPAIGLVLWFVLIAVRVADMIGANAAGAVVAASTSVLLVSLGINRLVAGLVIESRLPRVPAAAVAVV